EPARRKSDIFGTDAGVYGTGAQDAVAANCNEQFHFADRIVLDRDARAGVFRNFPAGSASGWRTDRDFDGMVAAEGERRGRPGNGASGDGCTGYFSSRLLSHDAASDGGPGIDFSGDYAGGERVAALAAKSAGDRRSGNWLGANRGERVFVLRIR